MINSTNSTRHTDEDGGDEIADPDTEPGMPPRQPTTSDHGGGDHPSIDIEGIGDPEALGGEENKVSFKFRLPQPDRRGDIFWE